MKCQCLISWKNKKNIPKCHLLKILAACKALKEAKVICIHQYTQIISCQFRISPDPIEAERSNKRLNDFTNNNQIFNTLHQL